MSYRTPFDDYFEDALGMLQRGSTADKVYERIAAIQEEDFRDHTFLKMAVVLAKEQNFVAARRFCSAIENPLEQADAFFETGRASASIDSHAEAQKFFDSSLDALKRLKETDYERSAVMLQVAAELDRIGHREKAQPILDSAIEAAQKASFTFEASKVLRGCARVLARWGDAGRAKSIAESIPTPEIRKLALEDLANA